MTKRKLPSPATLPVEVIWWTDASHGERQVMDLDLLRNVTVGYIAYEDDQQVLLVHEAVSENDWQTRPVDYTQIPKALIVKRHALGTVLIFGDLEASPSAPP